MILKIIRLHKGWSLFFLFLVLLSSKQGFTQKIDLETELKSHFGLVAEVGDDRVVCMLQKLGMRYVRVIFRWPEIEPQQDQFNWWRTDEIVRIAFENDFILLVTFEDTPSWANGGKPSNFPPADPNDWRDFVYRVVKRYTRFRLNKGRYTIRYWALWNEPNLKIFFRGNIQDYLEKIFYPGADAVHNANPNAKVVGPEFSWHWILNTLDWNLIDFFRSDALSKLDIFSMHVYHDAPGGVSGYLDGLIGPLLEEYGWKGRPFWITETGKPSCGTVCEDDRQIHYFYELLSLRIHRKDWLHKIFYFSLIPDMACDSLLLQGHSCENPSVRPLYQTLWNLFHGFPVREYAPECHHFVR